MNAKELATFIDTHEPTIESTWLDSIGADEEQTILRALRLLAAAEANDGTSPETNRLSDEISRKTFAQESIKADDVFDALDLARTLEQRCTGLAARVRELEEERCCTCRDGALKQPYSTMPPLQTLPWGTEK